MHIILLYLGIHVFHTILASFLFSNRRVLQLEKINDQIEWALQYTEKLFYPIRNKKGKYEARGVACLSSHCVSPGLIQPPMFATHLINSMIGNWQSKLGRMLSSTFRPIDDRLYTHQLTKKYRARAVEVFQAISET